MLFTMLMIVVVLVPTLALHGMYVSRTRPSAKDSLRTPRPGAPPTEGGGDTMYRKDEQGRWRHSNDRSAA